ncbi:single-stranded-DNA-specific exonuclease RecJ [Candidatus Falkowbacteria bacterium]|nr:single-stranded-DNA-specific exonuclease RecJ [Candidatus Falkowbacteria bacterium]
MSKRHWQLRDSITTAATDALSSYDQITAQLLFNRHITEPETAEAFLSSDYLTYKHAPSLFSQIEAAVEQIIGAIKAGKKIVIYGDYDADGVTATACLLEVLSTLKAKTDIYIPDRVSEGYGLNRQAIDEIAANGAGLIITVDNGIRNKEEVAYIKSIGLEVIITDHHVPPPEDEAMPDCLVINPMVATETYPFKYLAGVGVSAKLAMAIIERSKLDQEMKLRLEERILDLVALGTIADCVPLVGENRVLVKRGLEILNQTRRIGLKELIKIAKINPERSIDSWNVSFQLTPRLNAAGRMDHANTAFELLVTRDQAVAEKLAQGLNERNQERQKVTEDIVKAIIANVEAERTADKIIVAVSPSVYGQGEPWNEGTVGLVAGRLSEKYYLPALVITGNNDEIKGSGRSIDQFNLIKAVEAVKDSLHKYGGHAAACGFSIKGQENLERFIKDITEAANKTLGGLDLKPSLKIETEIDLSLVDESFLSQIERFAPFGEGNPRPVFLSRQINIVDVAKLGWDGRHLRLKLRNSTSKVKTALGFGQAEEWPDLKIGDTIDLAYYMELNEFNGKREVQLRIIDLKPSNA